MRRIVVWLGSTVTLVVLLFSYPTSTNKTATTLSSPSCLTTNVNGAKTSSASCGTTVVSASAKTITGSAVQTRRGPVQVELTMTGNTITQVRVLQQPTRTPRDEEINSYALPELMHETLVAQDSHIDMVSGATLTSAAYVQSLQSALDQAGR